MQQLLKVNQWWGYQYMVMLGSAYYSIYITPSLPPVGASLAKLGIFTVATIGIASFGYVLNDLTDIKQDLRSGHYNIMASHGQFGRFLILALVVLLGLLPWFWLPRSPLILLLLALEYGLFIAYSVAPLRLKTRGLLGPIADAIYAYVLPASIAALVGSNSELSGAMIVYLVALVVWCFLFGLLGILRHQLIDHSRDQLDGISTFVVRRGWDQAFEATLKLSKIVLPAYVLLIAIQGFANPLIIIGFCLHLAWQLWNWNRKVSITTRLGQPVTRTDRFQLIYNYLIGDFCWQWQPLILLTLLAFRSVDYLILLLAHLLLLPNGIKRMTSKQLKLQF